MATTRSKPNKLTTPRTAASPPAENQTSGISANPFTPKRLSTSVRTQPFTRGNRHVAIPACWKKLMREYTRERREIIWCHETFRLAAFVLNPTTPGQSIRFVQCRPQQAKPSMEQYAEGSAYSRLILASSRLSTQYNPYGRKDPQTTRCGSDCWDRHQSFYDPTPRSAAGTP